MWLARQNTFRSATILRRKGSWPHQTVLAMFKRVLVVYLSFLGILELVRGVRTLCKSVGQSFLMSCSFEIHSESSFTLVSFGHLAAAAPGSSSLRL